MSIDPAVRENEENDNSELKDSPVSEEQTADEDCNKSEKLEKDEHKKKIADLKKEPIKQPCILIFDSLLSNTSRARIIATLREYLQVEYKVKHGVDRDFSKKVVKGSVPRVPQQTNFVDCGLFVLQYVEQFFKEGIPDYKLPTRLLKNWFDPEMVSEKRRDIKNLLLELMEEQEINKEKLNLPPLYLSDSEDETEYESDGDSFDSQSITDCSDQYNTGYSDGDEEDNFYDFEGEGGVDDDEENNDDNDEDEEDDEDDEIHYDGNGDYLPYGNDQNDCELSLKCDDVQEVDNEDKVDDIEKGNNLHFFDDEDDNRANDESDNNSIYVGFLEPEHQQSHNTISTMYLTQDLPSIRKIGSDSVTISRVEKRPLSTTNHDADSSTDIETKRLKSDA